MMHWGRSVLGGDSDCLNSIGFFVEHCAGQDKSVGGVLTVFPVFGIMAAEGAK